MQKKDLTQTFRFGKNLAALLNQFIYKNGFCSAAKTHDLQIKILNAPVMLCSKDKEKNTNTSEAQAIKKYLATHSPDDYAILTPYVNQKKKIADVCNIHDNVLTVHKSQGKEWSTVILSIANIAPHWFTDSSQKSANALALLNTAVSRAKEELIVVCDYNSWMRCDQQFLTHILKLGTLIENDSLS